MGGNATETTVVVSVPFGDTEEDAACADEYGGDWLVLVDGDAAWAVAFSVLRPPESFWLPRVARLWRGWQWTDHG